LHAGYNRKAPDFGIRGVWAASNVLDANASAPLQEESLSEFDG